MSGRTRLERISERTRVVRDSVQLRAAVHAALTADVSEIVIDGNVAIDEAITITGLRRDLVIRGRGNASLYPVAGLSRAFTVGPARAGLTATHIPTAPSLTLRDLYVRTGAKFADLSGAGSVNIDNVVAHSARSTDDFLSGACDRLSIAGGSFRSIDVATKYLLARGFTFTSVDWMSAGTSTTDRAAFVIQNTICEADGAAGINVSGTNARFSGLGNNALLNPNCDVGGLGVDTLYYFNTLVNLGFSLVT